MLNLQQKYDHNILPSINVSAVSADNSLVVFNHRHMGWQELSEKINKMTLLEIFKLKGQVEGDIACFALYHDDQNLKFAAHCVAHEDKAMIAFLEQHIQSIKEGKIQAFVPSKGEDKIALNPNQLNFDGFTFPKKS